MSEHPTSPYAFSGLFQDYYKKQKDQQEDYVIDAMKDMLNGWKYIRATHGDLYGVGWDRAQEKMEKSISIIEASINKARSENEK